MIVENVGSDGEQIENMEGNVINPGHAIELGWFLLDYLENFGKTDSELHKLALEVCIKNSFEIGWDKTCGGLFYFLDCRGFDPEPLEWNMKLWWPHCEALIASLHAWRVSNDNQFLDYFKMTWKYCKEHVSLISKFH